MSFKNGNITRVLIQDFLTYDIVTVHPTPYLNLIIGPNGTGKSTILCAICICLGGKPDVTGRSKSIESYIKHGKECSVLEVELYNDKGQNDVIRRQFGKKESHWYLQGKQTSKKMVDEVISKYSIQIDNLCTFLPQDRVASFAKMNPIQLLEATEKAVGEPSLFENHELLRNNSSRVQNFARKEAEIIQQLETLQKQNATLKDIVENAKEKKQIEEEMKSLQIQMKYYDYDKKRKAVADFEGNLKSEQAAIKRLQASFQPLEQEIDRLKKDIQKKKNILNQKIVQFRKESEKCNQQHNQIVQLSDRIKDSVSNYQTKKEECEQCKRQIQDFNRQKDVFERQLENLPHINEKEIREKIQQLTRDIQKTGSKVMHLTTEQEELLAERQSNIKKRKQCENDMISAQDIVQQRMELLRRRNGDAYKAAKWLETNSNKFSYKFYNPICTLLNIKDPKYANAVESTISFNDLIAFVFENKDDTNLFKGLMDKIKIRVNIVHSLPVDLSNFAPPVSIDQLRQWDFYVYMSDIVEAPPAVLAYLYRNNGIFRIPLSGNENIEKDSLPKMISLFYMGNWRVSRSQSKYDRRTTWESQAVREGSLLKLNIDWNHIRELQLEIKKCDTSIKEEEEKMATIKDEEKKLRTDLENWRNEKQSHSSRQQERNVLKNRIEQKQTQIERFEAETYDMDDEKQKHDEIVKGTIKSMEYMIREASKVINKPVNDAENYFKSVSDVKLIELSSKTLQQQFAATKIELKSMQEKMQEVENQRALLKSVAHRCLQDLYKCFGVKRRQDIPPGVIEEFNKMTEEETESQLNDLKARRECIHTADEGEIKDYYDREKQINSKQEDLEKLKQKKNNQHLHLEECRNRWLPCITQLIEDISKSFTSFMERLDCAGEVELTHGEDENDYSQYGITIMVKFRGVDKLRKLTAQHQSGGERAVATALYMLSLQNLTAVPFRCVDEINQGMDPLNERSMLSMLIETAAKEESSQYFFVSPKLLPNLRYSDRVNTIITYSGSVIIPKEKFVGKFLMKYRRINKHKQKS